MKRVREGSPSSVEGLHQLSITPLGAGQEVGRSCIIVKYQGKTVMLDCGIHPGYAGLASLPFLDEVDLESVDVMLVTHFHLDHCAAVPYVVGHTSFKGRIFMTHPTKAIVHTLLKDFVKVSRGGAETGLYSDKDLDAAIEKTEVIDFHQTVDVGGIRVTPYRAGHVLGAAMFMVEIGGMRLLYTGDYSRIADRHMPAADLPELRPHVVVVESTYGVSRHLPREERETRFVQRIHAAVARGGRVLLPVVALGRAQELLLVLEEYWERHPELHGVPIYQARMRGGEGAGRPPAGLARRAISVYKTYIEMMNDDIKAAFAVANPFQFRHIAHLKSARQFDDSGVSRELFEAWCEDEKNCVVIADFAGTLAREILGNPAEVMTRNGVKARRRMAGPSRWSEVFGAGPGRSPHTCPPPPQVPLRMQVDAISFSAHADFPQTSEFLDSLQAHAEALPTAAPPPAHAAIPSVQPPHVVLVHGEATEMGRLKKALEQHAAALAIPRTVYMPKVTQPVLIHHRAERSAQLVGRLAEKPPTPGAAVRGLLVRRSGAHALMHHADLPRFTKLHPGRVVQRQAIALHRPFAEVRLALEIMFEGTQGAGDLGRVQSNGLPAGQGQLLRIGDAVTLAYHEGAAAGPAGARDGGAAGAVGPHVVLEWCGGSEADMVADTVVAVVLQAAGEPPGLGAVEVARQQALATGDLEAAAAAELGILTSLLGAQFGPARVDAAQGLIFVDVDGKHVIVNAKSGKVQCADEPLRARVQAALVRMQQALAPCEATAEADA
eukprot:scaffold18.g1920.t1